jgi:hypothetical protein
MLSAAAGTQFTCFTGTKVQKKTYFTGTKVQMLTLPAISLQVISKA